MRGPRHIDVASQSDPILVRADGTYLYGFTSVVDDIAFGITHVIRSEDHVTKSGAQIQMFRALDAALEMHPLRDAADAHYLLPPSKTVKVNIAWVSPSPEPARAPPPKPTRS